MVCFITNSIRCTTIVEHVLVKKDDTFWFSSSEDATTAMGHAKTRLKNLTVTRPIVCQ